VAAREPSHDPAAWHGALRALRTHAAATTNRVDIRGAIARKILIPLLLSPRGAGNGWGTGVDPQRLSRDRSSWGLASSWRRPARPPGWPVLRPSAAPSRNGHSPRMRGHQKSPAHAGPANKQMISTYALALELRGEPFQFAHRSKSHSSSQNRQRGRNSSLRLRMNLARLCMSAAGTRCG
jgi:hypothetical protein